jgi:hypothetical protein
MVMVVGAVSEVSQVRGIGGRFDGADNPIADAGNMPAHRGGRSSPRAATAVGGDSRVPEALKDNEDPREEADEEACQEERHERAD